MEFHQYFRQLSSNSVKWTLQGSYFGRQLLYTAVGYIIFWDWHSLMFQEYKIGFTINDINDINITRNIFYLLCAQKHIRWGKHQFYPIYYLRVTTEWNFCLHNGIYTIKYKYDSYEISFQLTCSHEFKMDLHKI